MNSTQKKLCFLGIIICIITCVLYVVLTSDTVDSEEVLDMEISLESGRYTENQTLTVAASKGTKIYYTDDYTTPDEQTGILYEQPINIVADEEVRLYTYRFKAYYPDGRESEVETRTFFVGTNVDSRYTTNVMHLTGEPEELFGDERGIFVFGTRFEEFIAANPDAFLGAAFDANFELRGRESEREVYVEYFTEDGELVLGQHCGVRIYGETTRKKNQKSFKLYARKEYDVQDDFKYPLLTKLLSQQDDTIAKKYERLIVRSGGTDNGYAYMRSELMAELASQAGFPDVMHSEPVCVYINGQYRGIYWLSNAYDDQYFENRYGEHEGSFVVLGGIDVEKEDDPEVQEYVDEYNAFYHTFAAMDLTDDANVKALNEVLDVENYLQYFAIQNYMGNWDSIHNNLKVYRYVTNGDSYKEQGVYDGRYRHLLFDLDFGFGLQVQDNRFGYGPAERTLHLFYENSPLFAALMEREDCRDYFISYTCDLRNGAMSYDNVSKMLVQKHGEREAELRYMLECTDVQKNSICAEWEGDCIEKYETVETNIQKILTYAEERPVAALCDMIETFGLSYEDAYSLYITDNSDYSGFQMNGVSFMGNDFAGSYLSTVPVVVTPLMSENEEFVHWIVNGEIYEAEELVLDADDVVSYEIHVQMVTVEKAQPILQIEALRAKGSEDYIELVNRSGKAVSTGGYYLSDSDDCYKYALPSVIMQPGETLRFWGKNCSSLDSLGEFALNFNIKQGETIVLSRGTEVLETVYVPDLSKDGVYKREAMGEGFKEVMGE